MKRLLYFLFLVGSANFMLGQIRVPTRAVSTKAFRVAANSETTSTIQVDGNDGTTIWASSPQSWVTFSLNGPGGEIAAEETRTDSGSFASFEIAQYLPGGEWTIKAVNPLGETVLVNVEARITSETQFALTAVRRVFAPDTEIETNAVIINTAAVSDSWARCQNPGAGIFQDAVIQEIGPGAYSVKCPPMAVGDYDVVAMFEGVTSGGEKFRRTDATQVSVVPGEPRYTGHRLSGTKDNKGKWATFGLLLQLDNPQNVPVISTVHITVGVEGRPEGNVTIPFTVRLNPGRNDLPLFMPGGNWAEWLNALGGAGKIQFSDLAVYDPELMSASGAPVIYSPWVFGEYYESLGSFPPL